MSRNHDSSFSIPASWTSASVNELCEKIQDGTHFSPQNQMQNGEYPYVTAKNVRPAGLDLTKLTYLEESEHRKIYDRCDVRTGDVLLVKDGVNTGDVALNTIQGEISLLSSVCFLRPWRSSVTPQFLKYYIQSPQGFASLTGRMTGTAIKRIILRKIKETSVVIAPLSEQHRIVEAIETQLSKLDDAVANLERVRGNLKRYRASVLKAAVEGRLVPTEAELAREEGRDYEPAEVLLERILKERRKRWEEAELEKMRAKGKVPKDDKWKGKYKEPVRPDTGGLPGLPEGWCWGSTDQIIREGRPVCYGVLKAGPHDPDGVPLIRVTDIVSGDLSIERLKRCNSDREAVFSRARLDAGDLIVSKDGSIGHVALVPVHLQSANITQHVLRVSAHDQVFAPYLRLALLSPFAQGWMKGETRGVALQGINVGDFRRLPIPLPPLSEQKRIVKIWDNRSSVMEALNSILGTGEKRCLRLRQSILKAAFEGKLVPQDPNDEPASVLLERIRNELKSVGCKTKVRERKNGNRT